uniref:ATP synthase F0 subunit 8 n=1 Tax=Potamometra macrokosos TaxID=2853723 RepID=UPI001EDE1B32|nr:ATP synthase F0 subunit 8 [Potamometra macrokosos]UJY96838.1 ATP synthase F0 subunit 8 [Potamometra macrokosos]UJY96851.1 ATP synthase F0 subunit 8 [Potamometra macrokosos]UJY96864.1 ATP synthase F0 subunit 8 [Potamometra macrokosos]UJY96877.1 ATP synthase F0 subunit 8 [Potamometra macrokosos]
MPQMAPLSWFSLMIMFTICIIMINAMMYFNKNYITKSLKQKKNMKFINWKW